MDVLACWWADSNMTWGLKVDFLFLFCFFWKGRGLILDKGKMQKGKTEKKKKGGMETTWRLGAGGGTSYSEGHQAQEGLQRYTANTRRPRRTVGACAGEHHRSVVRPGALSTSLGISAALLAARQDMDRRARHCGFFVFFFHFVSCSTLLFHGDLVVVCSRPRGRQRVERLLQKAGSLAASVCHFVLVCCVCSLSCCSTAVTAVLLR